MSRRPVTPRSTDLPRSASAASAPAHRFAVDVDRPKRIDLFIDYFGTGDVPSGPSRLDADGVRRARSVLGISPRALRADASGPSSAVTTNVKVP